MAHLSGNAAWQDYPISTTPINATRLEALEAGLDGNNPLVQAGLRVNKLRVGKVEAVSVAANTEFPLLNVNGPGSVQSVWMAIGGGNGPALDARLRVYYDGSATPSIDVDLGTLLATHFGASGANHSLVHMHAEIGSLSDAGFLMTFPMPFGTSIKVAYYNSNTANQTAQIFSMVAYRLTSIDYAAGLRLRCSGSRFLDQSVTRTSATVTTIANLSGGPGWIVYHSQVGGVGAVNLSWLERNIQIVVDGEAVPQVVASGTEDWYDSAWYFKGLKDSPVGFHSYIGTDQPAAPNQYVVGMATDLLSKWGGVPFTSSAVMTMETEAACSTGDRFCWAVLYYQ